jgi:hypothetical protein
MRRSSSLHMLALMAACASPAVDVVSVRGHREPERPNIPPDLGIRTSFTSPLPSASRRGRRASGPSQAKLRRQRRRGGR